MPPEEMPFARGGLGLKCMALNCENPLTWQEIKDRLPDQLDSIQALENHCAEFCVLSVEGLCLVKCPNCNCAIGIETSGTENGTNSASLKFQCPKCQFEMCRKCKAKWDEQHKDLTCEQFDKLKNYKDDEIFCDDTWGSHESLMKCPKCKKCRKYSDVRETEEEYAERMQSDFEKGKKVISNLTKNWFGTKENKEH
ncbi:hypothetical protein niasHT_038541 [Heterodera trifolii]|uniref:RING-type domain-containing protein n=1 Tax=Heterodera trifolii TaxID=157864 RepID=A0ABD2IB75_9BILA